MSLTDVKVKNRKPGEKQIKLFDGGGLYLLVPLGGGKYWRLKYRIDGRKKVLALGTYPRSIPGRCAGEAGRGSQATQERH